MRALTRSLAAFAVRFADRELVSTSRIPLRTRRIIAVGAGVVIALDHE